MTTHKFTIDVPERNIIFADTPAFTPKARGFSSLEEDSPEDRQSVVTVNRIKEKTVRDIVVTSPKSRMTDAAQEAEDAKNQQHWGERSYYFRNLGMTGGANLGKGSRVYYVENRYLRGFGTIESDEDVLFRDWNECDTTGRVFGKGWYAYIPADSWQWVVPIPFRGFQGWRYAPAEWRDLPIVGGWLDPKP